MLRILLATHGGPSAEGAARVASALAARLGATLDVLCVREPPPLLDFGTGFGPVLVADADAEQELERRVRVDVIEQLHRCGAHEPITPDSRTGACPSLIAEEADRRGAALVVIGLGPHRFVDRALGSETALQLVQMARTPILAVPADATALPRRIVAGIDFGRASLHAATIAARWLVAGDTLHLATVTTTATAAARARLAELSTALPLPDGAHVAVAELHGDPASALLEYCDHAGGELLALGSHEYGVWRRLTRGSIASKLLRLATHALLIAPDGCVPAAERAHAAPASAASPGA